MMATYLPLIAVPAVALVFAIRQPSRVTHGRPPVSTELVRGAAASAMLIACGWFVVVIASYVREWGCPGGFDGAGKCIEAASWDLGPTGIVLLSLPLVAAVALALAPADLSAAPPRPKSPTRAPRAQSPASKPEPASPAAAKATAPGGSSSSSEQGAKATEPDTPAQDASEAASPSRPAEPPATVVLEGPVSVARVAGETSELEAALDAAREAIGKRPGVVFSPYANDEANGAFARLAEHLSARRYVALTPDGSAETAPNPGSATHFAGGQAAHASELALDLAGGAIDSLILLDARVELSPLALDALQRVGSVAFADTHGPVTQKLDVLLPAPAFVDDGGHLRSSDGELRAAGGDAKDPELSRAALVDRLLERLGGDPSAPIPEPPPAAPSIPTLPPIGALGTPTLAGPPKVGAAPVIAPAPATSAPSADDFFAGLGGPDDASAPLFPAPSAPAPSVPAPSAPLPSAPAPSAPKAQPRAPGAAEPADQASAEDLPSEDTAEHEEE